MEAVKQVSKWGNSAGVLLPREWLGSKVKVVLLNPVQDSKKETFALLEPYLEEVQGIYLTGSYARQEQTPESDVDVLVITKSLRKEIVSGKYMFSCIPLESIKKSLKKDAISFLPRIREAQPWLNAPLLAELREIPITKQSFKPFKEATKRIIDINSRILALEGKDAQKYSIYGVVYSVILRLRGVFLMHCAIEGKTYRKKTFFAYLQSALSRTETKLLYTIYEARRDDHQISASSEEEVRRVVAKALFFLNQEMQKYA